jgi:hypothetical protein
VERPPPQNNKQEENEMRITIKTNGPVSDKDIRALYLLMYALDNSTPGMKIANLQYIVDRMGYELIPKRKTK